MSMVRAKLKVSSVVQHKGPKGETSQESVTLSAVCGNGDDDVNKQWSQWTPHAEFKMTINNPGAMNKLMVDQEYFVDFTPAD